MAHLTLSLLGPFQALLDGEPISGFTSNKVRALLAYLAVEATRPHARRVLAALLWPDQPDSAALSALRHALSDLRGALGDRGASVPLLLIGRDTLRFNAEAGCQLDVTAFQQKLSAISDQRSAIGRQRSAATRKAPTMGELQSAVALYRGPFLEGFSLADSSPFEGWALLKREELSQQVLVALGTLAAAHEARGEYEEAIACARRQLELEPWLEEAHRQLMRALALSARRSAALAQYAACQ
ncbi:MAG TPA: BTAD domain-containing putative transcriptional regulator, partial [Anaerolineae bacterium]|nr:BTAD domain-containing putative transcriptional regulator [Anaerolineae bacterium]